MGINWIQPMPNQLSIRNDLPGIELSHSHWKGEMTPIESDEQIKVSLLSPLGNKFVIFVCLFGEFRSSTAMLPLKGFF